MPLSVCETFALYLSLNSSTKQRTSSSGTSKSFYSLTKDTANDPGIFLSPPHVRLFYWWFPSWKVTLFGLLFSSRPIVEGKAALLSNAVRILAGHSNLPSFAFFPLLRALTRVYSPGLALESVGDDTFSSLISIIRCVLHGYLSPIILSLMAFCLSNSPIHSSMLPISTTGLYPPKCQM